MARDRAEMDGDRAKMAEDEFKMDRDKAKMAKEAEFGGCLQRFLLFLKYDAVGQLGLRSRFWKMSPAS